jgi:hypothetical protein
MRRRYRRSNPKKSSSGETVALVGLGVLVLGGVGYYLYTQSQGSSATAGNTSSTILGPAGSNQTLPGASTSTQPTYAGEV